MKKYIHETKADKKGKTEGESRHNILPSLQLRLAVKINIK